MKTNLIGVYLRALERELKTRWLFNQETLAEIESHLLEAAEEGEAQGLTSEAAQRQAVERFGPPELVARRFAQERNDSMQKIWFVIALAAGLSIAYIDASPHWDDTGITVFGLLFSAGIIGLLIKRRPWLYGLAIGIWIPLWSIYKTHDFKFLFVLLIPMIAVYAGWGFRKVLRKAMHPA